MNDKLTIENVKDLIILIVPYLTLCGCVYNIIYWSGFGLYGMQYIEISDIVKFSIYPIFSYSIAWLMTRIIAPSALPEIVVGNFSVGQQMIYYFVRIALLIVTMYTFFTCKNELWFVWAFAVSQFLTLILFGDNVLRKSIVDPRLRFKVIEFVTIGIITCIAFAKFDSQQIIYNKHFQYIVTKIPNQNSADTLKYIGNDNDNVIFTNMKNESIIIISSKDTMKLYKK